MRNAMLLNDQALDMVAGGKGGKGKLFKELFNFFIKLFEKQDDNKRKHTHG